MKTTTLLPTIALFAASCGLLLPSSAPAQTTTPPPYGQPNVFTKEQAQAQSKTQMAQAQLQYINLLERGFDQLSNIVTANSYHLTKDEVVAGFGDAFNAQTQQEGALMLATIIKANRILGRNDRWLTQDWVQAWIAVYRLDPTTGEALPPAP